jgi:hypothetical protein
LAWPQPVGRSSQQEQAPSPGRRLVTFRGFIAQGESSLRRRLTPPRPISPLLAQRSRGEIGCAAHEPPAVRCPDSRHDCDASAWARLPTHEVCAAAELLPSRPMGSLRLRRRRRCSCTGDAVAAVGILRLAPPSSHHPDRNPSNFPILRPQREILISILATCLADSGDASATVPMCKT